jgi:hypothetical protein
VKSIYVFLLEKQLLISKTHEENEKKSRFDYGKGIPSLASWSPHVRMQIPILIPLDACRIIVLLLQGLPEIQHLSHSEKGFVTLR